MVGGERAAIGLVRAQYGRPNLPGLRRSRGELAEQPGAEDGQGRNGW